VTACSCRFSSMQNTQRRLSKGGDSKWRTARFMGYRWFLLSMVTDVRNAKQNGNRCICQL